MKSTLHHEHSPARTPINEYKGKYPCLTVTDAGTVMLWHARRSLTILAKGDPLGWKVGAHYVPSESEIESWGEDGTLVTTEALTVTFN